jgi:hypothetical protein
MKLGQLLIADGIIGGDQLQEALDAQLTYGGHLGTCLIELGYLSEERLAQELALASGVPCAPAAALLEIPRFVLDALPQDVVQKHSAVPIGLEDQILDVAMIDPKNRLALEELRSVSGCAIRSWIAPEVRILQAMERYYDVPRRTRYVTLTRVLDRGRPSVDRAPSTDFSRPGGRRASESRASAGSSTMVLESSTRTAGRTAAARAVVDPLAAISNRLCEASTDDEIADLVLAATSGEIRRRVLFRVRGGNATVWRVSGAEIAPHSVADMDFPILAEPIFGLLNGEDHYAGPLPTDPIHLGFYRKLGIPTPKHLVLVPVHLDDQLIAMFYGDCGRTGAIGADFEQLRRLLAKAALAINVVRTEQRIHAI